ncbi:MAG TPA: hypothetical protein PLV83_02005 [Bacilli bacterium]|nr:hypothetical protein [Bacilli bacterium]
MIDLRNAATNKISTSIVNTDQLVSTVNKQYYEGNIKPEPNTIFVFGSNPEGRHGAGAAKIAKDKFGAIYGQGEGLQGNAYALPTKDLRVKENNSFKSIPSNQIIESIKKLYEVARQNPIKQFKVAYRNTVEKSLNGYTGLEMIEMFNNAGIIPSNIVFSKEWIDTNRLSININTGNKQLTFDFTPVITTTTTTTTQPTTKFEKKNIFTVTPIQTVDKKAKSKASIATQYIGFAEGIPGSSTALYAKQAGQFANTGNYSSNDIIFVSIGGRRGTVEQQKIQQDRTIREAIKALEAGATLITDNKTYVENNPYNTGEKRLAANLNAKGYIYSEVTVDGHLLGVWNKSIPTKLTQNDIEISCK